MEFDVNKAEYLIRALEDRRENDDPIRAFKANLTLELLQEKQALLNGTVEVQPPAEEPLTVVENK